MTQLSILQSTSLKYLKNAWKSWSPFVTLQRTICDRKGERFKIITEYEKTLNNSNQASLTIRDSHCLSNRMH